jgi:hypothetical protein
MRKSILGLAATTAVATTLIAGAASASVNVDATGHGFVGKGDVQTALGNINNSAIQTMVDNKLVKFTYVTTDTYEVVNAWATGNADNPVSLSAHEVTVTTTVGVNAAVNSDPRQVKGQKQWTGFNLNGIFAESAITTGTVPAVSETVAYQTFSWDTTAWDGTYDEVTNPNFDPTKPIKGSNTPTIQVKHFVTTTHTTDQMPVDEFGNLYTEGNDKAVVSVEKIDSVGGLFVNGIPLPNTPIV